MLRNLRHCKAMEQDLSHYDRLPPGDENKCYSYLLRTARTVLDSNRLHWYRDELSRSIGGTGWAKPAEKGGGKGGGKKSEKGGGKKKKEHERAGSPGKGKSESRDTSRDRSPSRESTKDERELCKAHLRGKCKLQAKDCTRKHNPPCRFFARGACTNGKDCAFPHHQSTAVVNEQEESSTEERGRSTKRDKKGKKEASKASGAVCALRNVPTGISAASAVGATKMGPMQQYMLGVKTPTGIIKFWKSRDLCPTFAGR